MLASELLEKGTRRVTELNSQLLDWMVKYEYKSIQQMRGSMSQKNVSEPAAFERANLCAHSHLLTTNSFPDFS